MMLSRQSLTTVQFVRDLNPIDAWVASTPLAQDMSPSAILNSAELQRYYTFQSRVRRLQFLGGRYCAKSAVAAMRPHLAMTDIDIRSGVFGQPILHHPDCCDVAVSISHSLTECAAIACDRSHPVGIDIECVRPNRARAIRSVLTAAEQSMIERLEITDGPKMTIAWSARESLSKVLTSGLMTSPHIYELGTITPIDSDQCMVTFRHFHHYKCQVFWQFDRVLALCFPKHSTLTFESAVRLVT